MTEEPILGEPYVKEKAYDLEQVVVLNLGDAGSRTDSDILNLLNTYFSNKVQPDEKKRVLDEKFNIAMTKKMEEEVNLMCNLSSAIEQKGREEGREEGKFETTGKYYRNGIITAEYAAYDLGMSEAEFFEKVSRYEQGLSEKE